MPIPINGVSWSNASGFPDGGEVGLPRHSRTTTTAAGSTANPDTQWSVLQARFATADGPCPDRPVSGVANGKAAVSANLSEGSNVIFVPLIWSQVCG